jgi:ABC-type lipoprotein export system ATPase subunit
MIELSRVKKSYQIGGETIDVLREINMKIEPGEYLVHHGAFRFWKIDNHEHYRLS